MRNTQIERRRRRAGFGDGHGPRRGGRIGLWALLHVCLGAALHASEPAPWPPTVLLISLDGFHPDYQARTATPALDRLCAGGVRAEALRPVFPTKTFPNHYTVVTGLFPAHHGVVANAMYDPMFEARFGLDGVAPREGRWYGGEPIWATAQRQGRRSGTYFWPGADAEIGGLRPTYNRVFDDTVPHDERVDQVLGWLDLPAARRPAFLSLYFSTVDGAGHRFGPRSPEVLAAVRSVDSTLTRLLTGLERRDLLGRVDLLVISDHGMAELSPERLIFLDDYIDLERVDVVDWSPVTALRPLDGTPEAVHAALQDAHPHFAVFRRGELPARLRYDGHRRIQPVIGLADEGWTVTSRARLAAGDGWPVAGAHGYDNQLPSMQALFIAHGPSFRRGVQVPAVDSIHLYSLMCHILGLEPAPNDGDLAAVAHVLAP